MVEKWFADFKRGRTKTNDIERSGRPNSAAVPKDIKKVLVDRKLKLREIVDSLKISEDSVFTILHEYLSMRKLCSKWVPRFSRSIQKRNKKYFFMRYVTMNETSIHHYTPESNRP